MFGALLGGIGSVIGVGKAVLGNPLKALGWASRTVGKHPLIGSAIKGAWDSRQTNTAYQRQMRDMKRAGLNPILAAKMGGAQSAQLEGLGSVANNAQANYQQNKQIEKNIEQLDQTIRFSKNENEVKEMILKVYKEHPDLAFWNDVFKGTDPKDWLSALTYDEILNKAKQVSNELKKAINHNRQGNNPYRNR